jgi:hypothetical protein
MSDFVAGKRNPPEKELISLKTEINKMKNATKKALEHLEKGDEISLKKYFRMYPINILPLMGDNRAIQSAIISYRNGKTHSFPFLYAIEIRKELVIFNLELNI